MNNSKKILIVTSEFPPEPGGIGNHAYNLSHSFIKENFTVEVISDQRLEDKNSEDKFDAKLSFKIHRIQFLSPRLLMYFSRILKGFKYASKNDVIFASGKFSLWSVALISFFYNKKYIAVIHGSEVNSQNTFFKKITDLSLKRFDKVIAVSNFTKNLVSYLKLSTIEVIPNGFELNDFNHSNRGKVDNDRIELITVGSVTERKGQLNVIKALPHLLLKNKNIRYTIVGNPSKKDAFMEVAEKLNVSEYVRFCGVVSEEKKIALLKSSDIFVMLSENLPSGDVEGFGIALLEANSIGIPVIGAINCGIEDAVDNYKSGILIHNKKPQELEDAIIEIINNYAVYSNEGRLWAENFTWDRIIKKYIKL